MSENKSKIEDVYQEIGKLVYEKYLLKEEIKVEQELLDNCSFIDTLANENEEIRMELLKLKDLKQCPNCHTEIELEYEYCPKCGQKQEVIQEDETNVENDAKQENPEYLQELENIKHDSSSDTENDESPEDDE